MANIYSLQLLRNGSIFSNYEAAVNAITGSSVQDGVIKLARYNGASTDSGNTKYSTNVVKTVFGIYAAMEGNSGWTIFDSYHEVIANLQSQIDAITGGPGSIAQQIQDALDALDFAGVTGNVVTQVTQENGFVAASGANVGNLALTDYDEGTASGHVAATDSINEAIAKLQNQIDAVNDKADAGFEGLDYDDSAVTGSYVSEVDETNGVISVTRVALPSAGPFGEAGKPITGVSETLGEVSASAGTINAEYVNVTGSTFSSTTVQAALEEIEAEYKAADAALKDEILGGASTSADTLGELEALINNLDADAATYTIRKDVESLPAEIKERYTLVETKNGTSTDKQVTIDIPKDSHIVSINYIESGEHAQNLEYVYIDASGNTQTTYVDMANLVLESEFASGVTSTNGLVHGVVAPTSEKDSQNNPFLTVGADGFKLSGVQSAITTAIEALDADVTSTGGEKVAVEVVEADGVITAVTVTETDIASAAALDALSGKTVTGIDMTGGTAAITANTDGTKKITINTDSSQIAVANYSAATGDIADGDTIGTALAKLEDKVDTAASEAANAHSKVEKDSASATTAHMTLTSATDANSAVTYTIGLVDVASDSALTAAQTEIDAIETAVGLTANGTYSADTTNAYTSAATSVADAINKLDDAVAQIGNAFVQGVKVNNVALDETDGVVNVAIAAGSTAANDPNAIHVETDNSTGAITLTLGTLDCGEYN